MPITSQNFLDSAKKCSSLGDEADYRNTVSRAYYSMYHEALSSLLCIPNYSSNHHSNLISYLRTKSENSKEPFDTFKMRSLAYRLDQQRQARHEADYDISSVEISKDIAESAIAAADLFFDDWSSLKLTSADQNKANT
ncbi:TPA: HEPN domain-containing protein [Yersinia enterocolitica]|nr:HEPN domain-containing protein [Yersinia enterocolitica]